MTTLQPLHIDNPLQTFPTDLKQNSNSETVKNVNINRKRPLQSSQHFPLFMEFKSQTTCNTYNNIPNTPHSFRLSNNCIQWFNLIILFKQLQATFFCRHHQLKSSPTIKIFENSAYFLNN